MSTESRSEENRELALREILQLTDRPNNLADALDTIRQIAERALEDEDDDACPDDPDGLHHVGCGCEA